MGGSSYKRGGRDRDQDRSALSATTTKPSKFGYGLETMTVTVPQDLNKRKVHSNEGTPCQSHVEPGGLRVTRNGQNEGVLPSQPVQDGGRLCQFVEGWKRITNGAYVL